MNNHVNCKHNATQPTLLLIFETLTLFFWCIPKILFKGLFVSSLQVDVFRHVVLGRFLLHVRTKVGGFPVTHLGHLGLPLDPSVMSGYRWKLHGTAEPACVEDEG